ncbi:LOW QUALITY PROTEIN: stAR-related lipid transfer protein 8 [Megalops cyprinoides]|uniref:LOW QUALITY PROTEIN: stAR-related lipid transfer protein 8 n=1 Tax=Megalops cyprinoides TaxID=118141 RepID=UPI0018648D9A|nr:LOW QUALITY PROTEIN: stAR-related lipid transfer protein 8 [Megalops cyprinoides]
MAFFSCLCTLFRRVKGLPLPWDHNNAELEAKEACNWLRAAGFPQYAQLYEDALFPIDIPSVKKDHDFLDRDSLKSLCRRLTTLNKCASMKLEVHFQRKQSEDSEEDDLCAISDRWAFQRDSKRWSRLRTLPPASVRTSASSESALSDFSDLEVTSIHSSSSLSAGSTRGTSSSEVTVAEPTAPDDPDPPDGAGPGREEASSSKDHLCLREKPKRSTRSFLRRIESFRRKDKEREAAAAKGDVGSGTENARQGPLQPPASLHCTPNESLPGLKQSIRDRSSGTPFSEWKAHTICRTTVGRSPKGARGKTKSSALYLEDFEMGLKVPSWTAPAGGLGSGQESCLVHLPPDHKPGTFPKSLSIESLCPNELSRWQTGRLDLSVASNGGSQDFDGFRQRRSSCSSVGSVYDNVPATYGGSGDLLDLEGEKVFQHLDDVLQHVHGLQQNIDLWSKRVCPELGDGDRDADGDSEETTETIFPVGLHFEERSMSDVGTVASDYDSVGNSLNEVDEMEMRERRDSGVGASLTRPSRKLRWHSFQNSHRPSLTSASLEINRQSAAQLNLLQKFSLLRLTAIMEKYCVPNKHGWGWTMPKFMKRSKVPDYRDKNVFGVPPIINVQRSGQPLPQSIQQAMRYIRSQCLDQVGIFRKSGVKSRIQTLRQLNENSPDHVSYEGQSAYDVADMLKQYFRDLPEPVFTSKLTETFLQIYQCVPKDQRLQAAQATVILLPDENREVLQTLLYFLSDIASAQDNQMTAGNLAVCLAPSIFHLNVSKKEGTSPRLIPRRGAVGKPDQKDLNENMAATQGLSHMIMECKKLFQIPHDMSQSRNSYVAADAQPLPLHSLGCNLKGEPGDYRAYLEDSIQCLLRDANREKQGLAQCASPENTELSYKKVGDGHPIRLWKVTAEVEALPSTVLHRILRERHLWDDDLLHSRVIESLESNTEVYHYVTDSMAPHPRRDFVVLRRWSSDLPRGACVLVSSSVEHDKVILQAGLRAVLLTSRYLIEPGGMGRSRLTHYCRADLRGRSPEWYNKVFGHLCAVEVARIRDSFPVLTARGPETKL